MRLDGFEYEEELGGEMARQRMEEVWALKRNESVKVTSWRVSRGGLSALETSTAVKPCSTRSYEPSMIWITVDLY